MSNRCSSSIHPLDTDILRCTLFYEWIGDNMMKHLACFSLCMGGWVDEWMSGGGGHSIVTFHTCHPAWLGQCLTVEKILENQQRNHRGTRRRSSAASRIAIKIEGRAGKSIDNATYFLLRDLVTSNTHILKQTSIHHFGSTQCNKQLKRQLMQSDTNQYSNILWHGLRSWNVTPVPGLQG